MILRRGLNGGGRLPERSKPQKRCEVGKGWLWIEFKKRNWVENGNRWQADLLGRLRVSNNIDKWWSGGKDVETGEEMDQYEII